MSDKDQSSILVIGGIVATVLTNGAQYAGHTANKDDCSVVIEQERRDSEQDCSIKLLDCKNN